MQEWSKQKLEPSELNNGNEYEAKDQLSRQAVNAIVNNSFYASEKSAEALQTANEAMERVVEGEGTRVKVGGVYQGIVEFNTDPVAPVDFSEYERQRSKNLFHAYTGGVTRITKNGVTITINSDNTITINGTSTAEFWASLSSGLNNTATYTAENEIAKVESGKKYTFSLNVISGSSSDRIIVSVRKGTGSDTSDKFNVNSTTNTSVTLTVMNNVLDNGYIHILNGVTYSNLKIELQLEEGDIATEYKTYEGQIVHETHDAVEFAESEMQKSKNKLNSQALTRMSIQRSTDTINENSIQVISSGYYTCVVYKISNLIANKTYTFSCDYSYIREGGNIHIGLSNVNSTVYQDWAVQKTISTGTPGRCVLTVAPTGNELYLILYTNYSGENYNNTLTCSNIQLELGDTDTPYEKYNGEIVHKKNTNQYELIYDITSLNVINGESYTSGILVGEPINMLMSKFKKIICYVSYYGHNEQVEIDLSHETRSVGNYRASNVSFRQDFLGYDMAEIAISADKYTLNFVKAGYQYFNQDFTNSTSTYIYRIEGVY